jgi:very-short-patch-repair endonuclease
MSIQDDLLDIDLIELIKKNKVLSNIMNGNFGIHYIISSNEPNVLYNCSDIARIIGLKNIRGSVHFFNETEKKIVKRETAGGPQNMLYLSDLGLLKLLNRTRKPDALKFAIEIGIDVNHTCFSRIETDTIQCITDAFMGETMHFQYKVDRFAIDLYFEKYKIAVECDENHLDIENDVAREKQITDLLGCTFIRYKPYAKDFSIFKLINQIMRAIKEYYYRKKTT